MKDLCFLISVHFSVFCKQNTFCQKHFLSYTVYESSYLRPWAVYWEPSFSIFLIIGIFRAYIHAIISKILNPVLYLFGGSNENGSYEGWPEGRSGFTSRSWASRDTVDLYKLLIQMPQVVFPLLWASWLSCYSETNGQSFFPSLHYYGLMLVQ